MPSSEWRMIQFPFSHQWAFVADLALSLFNLLEWFVRCFIIAVRIQWFLHWSPVRGATLFHQTPPWHEGNTVQRLDLEWLPAFQPPVVSRRSLCALVLFFNLSSGTATWCYGMPLWSNYICMFDLQSKKVTVLDLEYTMFHTDSFMNSLQGRAVSIHQNNSRKS